ncbi:hypothetical protein RM844_29785 [Streptomyces sp. DSM 44915]|uniref:Protease n=1 Tax=Streptomyces chisholmiae TaxID=3075540 RepID=A0ABU2JZV5_9ACTN|nr:hypothetical protein [Streptomyces sp. DSM 44915]MDT0270470.1 hypothetical protein [Streptomyces sp. DSM 44915]
MAKFLLSLHVLAAIIAVGPITVAASLFPRYARQAFLAEGPADGAAAAAGRAATVAALLHRICRGYAAVGIAVPLFGLATGASLGVLTDAWLLVSMALTIVAAALLVVVILPAQEDLLHPDPHQDQGDAGPDADPVPAATAQGAAQGVAGGAAEAPAVGVRRDAAATRAVTVRLAMLTGVFNLLWATVVVLMIVRPGSTTSA